MMTGCPASLRHDRNSTVGTVDRKATIMRTANLVRKAWLEKIVERAFFEIEHAQQPNDQQQAGRDP
jgi:hypothetical protein